MKTVTAKQILRRAAELLELPDVFYHPDTQTPFSCNAVLSAAREFGLPVHERVAARNLYIRSLTGGLELRIWDFEDANVARPSELGEQWYTHRILALLSVIESGLIDDIKFEVES
jgi:hypothetical protein